MPVRLGCCVTCQNLRIPKSALETELGLLCRPVSKEQSLEHEKKPCLLCNDTGFVMEAEMDVTSDQIGKPEIFVPKPCPNGCLPPQKK
jgi:hypothetical protein